MVRINLIHPEYLADQHLVAEYDEILMLLGYVKRYPEIKKPLPVEYTLGKGHILFFKDKLLYLKKRHELLKKEMRKRGFATNIVIDLTKFNKKLINDWKADKKAFSIIKDRLIYKLNLKKDYYRYYGEKKRQEFFIKLIEKSN